MSTESTASHAPLARWIIHRNPTYLLSAACMAVGARLFLVSPSTRAGDVGLILLTLGFLQLYEWAVTAILTMLARWQRSPEDQPSLMLVAALFWTGPLAATAEMTAHRANLGLICAAGACIIALAELSAVRRTLRLQFSVVGRLAAAACVVLLAVAPPLFRIPELVNGNNELFLYAAWWLVGGIALAGVAVLRYHARVHRDSHRDLVHEAALLLLVIVATAAHLAGMNYAYFGHAQWFYGSPLLVAVAVVAIELAVLLNRAGSRRMAVTAMTMAVVLPLMAVALAHQHFDEHVPLKLMPGFLRDPLLTVLVIAGAAWWFGYLRTRVGLLLHTGSAAMAWAGLRAMRVYAVAPTTVQSVAAGPDGTRDLVVAGLYMIAAYFALMAIIRWSVPEGIFAIVVQQIALTLFVCDRIPADALVICASAGWSWLLCVHLLGRPSFTANVLPIAFLLVATWAQDATPDVCWYARSHAAAMLLAMIVLTLVMPASRYGLLTVCAMAANALFYSSRWIAHREHAAAAFIVLGGFALLAIGAAVSWRKQRLMAMLTPPTESSPEQQASAS